MSVPDPVHKIRARIGKEADAWKQGLALASYTLSVSPARTAMALCLLLLSSLCDGVSLLLLLPLLKFIGNHGHGTVLDFPTFMFAPWLGDHLQIQLWIVLLTFVALVLSSALFSRFKSVYVTQLNYDTVNQLRTELFTSIAAARWASVAKLRVSDLDHVLTGDIDRVTMAVGGQYQFFQNGIFLAAYVILSFAISFKMTLFATVSGTILFVIQRPIRRYAAVFGDKLTFERQAQYRTISDFLAGLKVTKSFNAEEKYSAQLEATLNRVRVDLVGFVRLNSLGAIISQTLSAVIVCIYIYMSYAVYNIDFAKIIVQLLVFMRIAPRFSDMQSQLQSIIVNTPAFTNMRQVTHACEDQVEQAGDAAVEAPHLHQALVFEGVSFRYGDNLAVDNISFSVPAGQVTAIIGESGGGKSTLADLAMGLQSPSEGRILIDGVALDDATRRAWRGRIAYVPQDTYLLSTSLAENLAIARQDATRDAMMAALKKGHALGFVERLPQGLDTLVGDGGLKFSGGERQRIALARALLRKPDLLILDEATSALDGENTARIIETIRELKGETTILLITHNPLVLSCADQIISVENGRVVQS
jgi:ATP-binding cassette, subfamily C, bacterial